MKHRANIFQSAVGVLIKGFALEETEAQNDPKENEAHLNWAAQDFSAISHI